MKVKAKLSEKTAAALGIKSEVVEVDVNIPSDLEGKRKQFGDDVVNAAAEDSLVITVQALMRRLMTPVKDKAGKITRAALPQAEIQKKVSEWKPDARSVVRQSAFEKASTSISKLSSEERAALLKQLMAANQGAGQQAAKRV